MIRVPSTVPSIPRSDMHSRRQTIRKEETRKSVSWSHGPQALRMILSSTPPTEMPNIRQSGICRNTSITIG